MSAVLDARAGRALASSGRVARVALRSPLALLDAAVRLRLGPCFFCQGEQGAMIGLGEVDRVEASGPSRFEQLDEALAERVRRSPELRGRPWLGGFSFEPEVSGAFLPFGAARFVRPRFLWFLPRVGSVAFLEAAEDVGELEWARILRWAEAVEPVPHPLSSGARVEEGDPAAWQRAMDDAQAAFTAGEARKVVLSRDLIVERPEPISAARVLAGLPARSPAEVAFAVFADEAAFVGLSPERLLQVEPGRVRAEALAGSSASDDPSGDALLESAKDLEEHRYVVDHIRERLEGLVLGLRATERPLVRRLGHIAHLFTPVEGRWSGAPSILRLAAAIHPTPAVGGTPAEAARSLIARAEGRPRGWYAGAVGVIEPDEAGSGQGELWVALRSALLLGGRARVFVGAGVVPASTPDGEWRETALKASRMLSALGAR